MLKVKYDGDSFLALQQLATTVSYNNALDDMLQEAVSFSLPRRNIFKQYKRICEKYGKELKGLAELEIYNVIPEWIYADVFCSSLKIKNRETGSYCFKYYTNPIGTITYFNQPSHDGLRRKPCLGRYEVETLVPGLVKIENTPDGPRELIVEAINDMKINITQQLVEGLDGRVLCLGAGLGYVGYHCGCVAQNVTIVEEDPLLVEFLNTAWEGQLGANVTIICADPIEYYEDHADAFDHVVVNLYNNIPASLPHYLYFQEQSNNSSKLRFYAQDAIFEFLRADLTMYLFSKIPNGYDLSSKNLDLSTTSFFAKCDSYFAANSLEIGAQDIWDFLCNDKLLAAIAAVSVEVVTC